MTENMEYNGSQVTKVRTAQVRVEYYDNGQRSVQLTFDRESIELATETITERLLSIAGTLVQLDAPETVPENVASISPPLLISSFNVAKETIDDAPETYGEVARRIHEDVWNRLGESVDAEMEDGG